MAEHAFLSPSSAHRWLICTPSARFEEGIEKKTSDWADEGSLAHEYCANGLLFALKRITESDYKIKRQSIALAAKQKGYNFNDIKYYGDQYISFCIDKLANRKHMAFVEQRFDLKAYIPQSWGTSDFSIIEPGKLTIIDYKHGQGVEVSAVDNAQLMLYALGVLQEAELYFDIQEIEMIIYQPRLNNISRDTLSKDALLEWGNVIVKSKAKEAWAGKGKFMAGNHCRFCSGKSSCKTLAAYNTSLAKYDFELPDQLTLEQIGKILSKAEIFTNWLQAVKDYALDQVLKGKKIPGFKLVTGRSNRSWIDEKLTTQYLLDCGYAQSEIIETKLKTIGELEKMLGKGEFHQILSEFTIKPKGAPTLVPNTDKRPELNSAASAAEDFKHLKL
jgi:hypothetical protein